jgi:DNA-binding SARP family transcriptional activator
MTLLATERLEIHTLGGLRLVRAGVPWGGGMPARAQALLVYLACGRGPQAREALAALLWDGDAQAAARLDALLAEARGFLEPYVQIAAGALALDPATPLRIDVTELDHRLALARALARRDAAATPEEVAALEKAVALYGGPFLGAFTLADAPGFSAWQQREQRRLDGAVVEALRRLVAHSITGSDPFVGIRYARQLLDRDPLDESLHRALILLLARAGQRAAALAHWDRCIRLLAEQGRTPDPAGADLVAWVRAGYAEQGARYLVTSALPSFTEVSPSAGTAGETGIFTALRHLRAAALPVDTAPLGTLLLGEIRAAYTAVVVYADLLPDGSDPLLRETLDRQWHQSLNRIGLLLDLLYPGREPLDLRRPLPGTDPPPVASRQSSVDEGAGGGGRGADDDNGSGEANTQHAIRNTQHATTITQHSELDLPDPFVARLLRPLVGAPAADLVALAAARFGVARRPLAARLADLASAPDPWLRACALFRIGELHLVELRDLVRGALLADDPLVRETAQHTYQALAAGPGEGR